MTHGRKPRKPRVINANVFNTAICRASRLTDAERATVMDPMRMCLKALREGVATELQHDTMHSCLLIAQAIERTGIVRGLADHFTSAIDACDTIALRCRCGPTWQRTPLYFYELDALATAVDLHEYQLQQLSAGELHAVVTKVKAATLSAGGRVIQVSNTDLAAMAA